MKSAVAAIWMIFLARQWAWRLLGPETSLIFMMSIARPCTRHFVLMRGFRCRHWRRRMFCDSSILIGCA